MRNDCLFHLASLYLPFSGLGSSGYGRYHGKYTFDTFSHMQPIMFRPCFRGSDFNYLRYHPFPQWKQTLLMKYVVGLPGIPNLNFCSFGKAPGAHCLCFDLEIRGTRGNPSKGLDCRCGPWARCGHVAASGD